ncbi:MAG: hypothetical protein IH811_09675 [Proteobacteria bacterium]|nr:hypothetical protein [Pseudomonadota bacterium]
MDTTIKIAVDAPPLSRSPWRFALYFYLKSRYTLLAIFVFEAAQAACTILLPYGVKEIIDAVTLANETDVDIFTTTQDALLLFALLNLGIVLFSRASGAALARATIDRLTMAVFPPMAMLAGMQLDLFTPLKDGPMRTEALGEAIGVDPGKLAPLLYALVAAELLTVRDGAFANTPEADHYLVHGRPHYVGGAHARSSDRW